MKLFGKRNFKITDSFDEDFYAVMSNEITEIMRNENTLNKSYLDYYSDNSSKMIFRVFVTDRTKKLDLADNNFVINIARDIFGVGMFAVIYQMRLQKPIREFSKNEIIDLLTIYDNNGSLQTPLKLMGNDPVINDKVDKLLKLALDSYYDNRCKNLKNDEFIAFLLVLYQAGITFANNDMKTRRLKNNKTGNKKLI